MMHRIKVDVSKLLRMLMAASLLLSATSALAHDSRPAYLELVETDTHVYFSVDRRGAQAR
jgi:hypothetical protein